MGNTPDAYGIPEFDDSYDFPEDLNDLAAALRVFANTRAGTLAERNALTSGQIRPGMMFIETDTGIISWHNGSEWRYISGVVGNAQESGTQSIPNNSNTVPTFPGSTVARGVTFGSNGFTVGTAGLYRISASVQFAAATTGYRTLSVLINGSPVGSFDRSANLGASETVPLQVAGPQALAASDVVTLRVVQTSGGSLNISNRYLLVERLA